MRLSKPFLVALLATTWALPVGAQAPQIAMQEDDPILTLGLLRFVNKLYVSDSGVHLTEVGIKDPENGRDTAMLANGFPILVATDPVLDPGGTVQRWQSLMSNSAGNIAYVLNLEEPPGGRDADVGVYWNSSLLALESGPLINPTVPAGFPPLDPDRVYSRLLIARINEHDSVLVLGEIGALDAMNNIIDKQPAIFRIDTDGMGGVTGVEVLIKRDDPDLLAGAWTVKGVSTLPNSVDSNDRDEWIGGIGVSGGLRANTAILVNGLQVAREGDPAPVEGREWDDLVNSPVSINNLGDWAFKAQLTAGPAGTPNDRQLILTNGDVFVRQLDTLPSIAPHQVDRMNAAPVIIADSGDIFWHMTTTNPNNAQDTLYMRNYDIVVQSGVTVVNGAVVNGLLTTQFAFSVSPSGRFWVGEVNLQGQGETMLMVDFGAVVPIPGCSGRNPATLVKGAGDPLIGSSVTLEMNNAQGVGVSTRLLFSAAPAVPGSPCGTSTTFGELLIALGPNLIATLAGQNYTGSPVQIPLAIPPDPSLVDLHVFAQGAFLDLAGVTGAKRVVLTNAIEIEIGSP